MIKNILITLFTIIFCLSCIPEIRSDWWYERKVPAWVEEESIRRDIEIEKNDKVTYVPLRVDDFITVCENNVNRFMKLRRLSPLNIRIRRINDCLEDEILNLGEFMLKSYEIMEFKDDARVMFQKIYRSMHAVYRVDKDRPIGELVTRKILERVTQSLIIILNIMIKQINIYQYTSEYPSKDYRDWYMKINGDCRVEHRHSPDNTQMNHLGIPMNR